MRSIFAIVFVLAAFAHAAWAEGEWTRKAEGRLNGASFSIDFSADAMRLTARGAGEKPSDRFDFYLVPDGGTFDYYRFGLTPADGKAAAAFFSEGGAIQPDPYAPVWTHEVSTDAKGWSAVATVPLTGLYMTRAASWKKNWTANVVRMSGEKVVASWAPVGAKPNDLAKFKRLADVPKRPAAGDVAVRSVLAEIDRLEGGRLAGTLRFIFYTGTGGRYRIEAEGCGVAERSFRGEPNKVSLPCSFPSVGRHDVRFTVTEPRSKTVTVRTYPVRVDFQPLRVKLTTPAYRDNFYPGQSTAKVAGEVTALVPGEVTVTLEGDGIKRQVRTIGGTPGGRPLPSARKPQPSNFSFSVPDFAKGEMTLTVACGEAKVTKRIRKIEPNGHRMAWIENGHLVLDGKPIFRRQIQGVGYCDGEKMRVRYGRERASFRETLDFNVIGIEPMRMIPGIEPREGVYDVEPSPAVLAKVDEKINSMKGQDFASWFLVDEPECRNISPVWLRHLYNHIAARDPYHTIQSDSRGGKAYTECFDLIQTHPYLNPINGDDGSRSYATPVSTIGSYIDAFEAMDRPDKALGLVPMAFAYRWTSIKNDYPTFDEFLASVWAGIVRGAKTTAVCHAHDIGDRPALYHGTRYLFEGLERLETLLLLGTRRTLAKTDSFESCLWEKGADRLAVAVNFTQKPVVAQLPGLTGRWREFRAARTFDGAALASVELKPFDVLILATQDHDVGLETLSGAKKRIAGLEYERTHRDNQLLEKYNDIVISSNMGGNPSGGTYKLIDGMYDMMAKDARWTTNGFIEIAFPKELPVFSKLRVHGWNMGAVHVDIRKDGAWRSLVPKTVTNGDFVTELDFGEALTTVRMKIFFPGARKTARNTLEVYEIELPRCGRGLQPASDKDGSVVQSTRTGNPRLRDEGVAVCWNETNLVEIAKWNKTAWLGSGTVVPRKAGGFTIVKNANRAFPPKADPKWLVMDIAAIRPKPVRQYRAWHLSIENGGFLAGLEGAAEEAMVYTLELPKLKKPDTGWIMFRDYGLDVDVNHITLLDKPANRVVCRGAEGRANVAPGDTIRVEVHFDSPCEEVSAEFRQSKVCDGLKLYPVNGLTALDLRPVPGTDRCSWAADVTVKTLPRAAPARTVFVKAVALGGAMKRPMIGNFTVPFVLARE